MRKRMTLNRGTLVLLVIALICTALGFLCLSSRSVTEVENYVSKQKSGVGALTDAPVTQGFTVHQNGLTEVEVAVSNYNKKLTEGDLTLTLTDDSGNEWAQGTWPVSDIKKTQSSIRVVLTLPEPRKDSAGAHLTLAGTSTCTEGKGITLKTGVVEEPVDGQTLTLQDGTVDAEHNLVFSVTYTSDQPVWMGSYTLWLLALCALCCLPLVRKEDRKHA